jgi:hypothetical protein
MSKKISATHCLTELKTKERLLSSIHKISSLLTRPISLDKIPTCIVKLIFDSKMPFSSFDEA